MRLVFALTAAAALVAASPTAAPGADKASLRASIAKSMALLDKAQVRFEKQATCASCHNQVQPMVTAQILQTKGMPIDAAVFKRQQQMAAEVIHGRYDMNLTHATNAGAHIVIGSVLNGLGQVKYPADEATDAAVVFLLSKQAPDGGFPNLATRFPQGETEFDTVLVSVRAIDAYAPPSLRGQADAAIAKARAWTIATPAGEATDGRVKRLNALLATKAPAGEVAKARALLVSSQKADGGWSQRAGMDSDAYATGDALIALHHAGMKATDPVYQKGLDYLLKTQAADGSWHVKAHALPIQPPIDAGFPYGQDQWISAWATGYAAEAMAYAL